MTYDVLRHPSAGMLNSLSEIFVSKPPVYGLSLALPLLLFGTSATYKMALWINVLFYVPTIIGIYFLAKEFLSKTSSLLAAMLFAFYGFPLFYLHFVYSETATTTFVVLTLLFLAKSKYFSDRKNTVLAAFFLSVGCITRWVTPLFTIGAIGITLGTWAFTLYKTKKRKPLVLNVLLFASVAITIPLIIYYIPNALYFSSYATNTARSAPEWVESLTYLPKGLSDPFSIHSVMFYFNILSQQTVYLFLLFCIGFVIAVLRFKKYLFFLISFIIPYIFFTFFSVLKDDRYIVPIYPTMAIISAIVFEYIRHKKIKTLIISLTIIISILNFLGASWGIGPLGKQGLKDIVLPEFIRHPRRIYMTTMVWPPIKDVTKARTIARIVTDNTDDKRNPYVLNTYTVNPLELDVALTSLEQFEQRGKFRAWNLRVITRGDYNDLFTHLNTADFIITKTKIPVDETKYTTYDTDQMVRIFNHALELPEGKLPDAFEKIATVYYPLDMIDLHVYKKKREVTKEEWVTFATLLKKIDPQYTKKIEEGFEKKLIIH